MWQEAIVVVNETFFKDTIELYEEVMQENSIGESIISHQLVGTYSCNVQSLSNNKKKDVSGESMPEGIRVSVTKEIPLSVAKTYKLKIIQARITFTNELWEITGWTEAQISTVIQATREVAI